MSSPLSQLRLFIGLPPPPSSVDATKSECSSPATAKPLGFDFGEEKPDQISLNLTERFVTTEGKVIEDGADRFPNSVVEWTQFTVFELQEMFAMLREQEEIVQGEIAAAERAEEPLVDGATNEDVAKFLRIRLREIERQLIWMAHNVTGTYREVQRRRRAE